MRMNVQNIELKYHQATKEESYISDIEKSEKKKIYSAHIWPMT